MKRSSILVLLSILVVVFFTVPSIGAVLSLKGTWKGTAKVINLKGQVYSSVPVVLVVQVQSGNLLKGYLDLFFQDGTERFPLTGTFDGSSMTLTGNNPEQGNVLGIGKLINEQIRLQASAFTQGSFMATMAKVPN